MLKEDYCLSDTYRALVYGPLLKMGESNIDILALRLPMATLRFLQPWVWNWAVSLDEGTSHPDYRPRILDFGLVAY